MDKAAIIRVLNDMGTLLELQGANPFKSRAFQNAARALEGTTDDLAEMAKGGTLREIRGIGEAIEEIITDLVTTGSSKEYNALKKSFPEGVLMMLRIPGLGPKKVRVLYEKLKITSLEKLEQAISKNKVADLAGFGEKTQENILKGIERLRAKTDKFLYSVAYEAATRIFDTIKSQKGIQRGEIAGSLRRRKEIVGDIDIVVSAREKDRGRIMDSFVKHEDVRSVVAQGDTKSSVVTQSGINCDVRIVSDEEFPFALNYFTGSKEHNVEMRTRAKRYGWSLNEYGFSKLGEAEKRGDSKRIVASRTEEDLYRALELAYVPPELRENMGEIEAAESNGLPRLIEDADIRGTFHCHTTYSDGSNSLQEMADAARNLGWEYLGIADHSKVAAYARGLSEQRLKEQKAEIEKLNAQWSDFRLFAGTECDILASGALDWSDKILATLDYVVASVHAGFKMTVQEMTKRIIKALKNKYVTMIGHPTGRVLLSRDPYPVDMTQVIDAAADYGKIIELNAHPMRLDIDWRMCKYAREKGVRVAINPDAHNTNGLRDVFFGVGIARKGWLERDNVVNTRGLNGVLPFLTRR